MGSINVRSPLILGFLGSLRPELEFVFA